MVGVQNELPVSKVVVELTNAIDYCVKLFIVGGIFPLRFRKFLRAACDHLFPSSFVTLGEDSSNGGVRGIRFQDEFLLEVGEGARGSFQQESA